MKARYKEDKAVQIAALLLEKEGNKMNYTKLIKLMYVVERRSLIKRGVPITFDNLYSLDNGPILSLTLDNINGQTYSQESTLWSQFISKLEQEKYSVYLIKSPGIGKLSRAEVKLVNEVYEELGHMTYGQLISWSHNPRNIPEWQDPNGSSIPIKLCDILGSEGYSDDAIASDSIYQ
ncbi:MAG: Panacea domain-containing protein [Cyanobacteria bacterium P01_G01_bin.54]